jgi:hypothetical protein
LNTYVPGHDNFAAALTFASPWLSTAGVGVQGFNASCEHFRRYLICVAELPIATNPRTTFDTPVTAVKQKVAPNWCYLAATFDTATFPLRSPSRVWLKWLKISRSDIFNVWWFALINTTLLVFAKNATCSSLNISKCWGYLFIAHQTFATPRINAIYKRIERRKLCERHNGMYVSKVKSEPCTRLTKPFSILKPDVFVANDVLAIASRTRNTPRFA